MLTLLSGQRRRIALFALTMPFGLLLIGLLPGLQWTTKLLSLLLAPLFFAALAAVVIAHLPARRGWLECIGAGVLLGGVLGALTPLDGLLGLPLALAFSAGLITVLHGAWRERLPMRMAFASGASGQLRADGAELWSAVVPGAGRKLVSARLVDIEEDANDPQRKTFYAGLMACGELSEEVTLSLLEADSSGTARIHIEGEDIEGNLSSGVLTLKITEIDPDTSLLSLHESRAEMLPGEAVERWFDDVLGCELRHLQSHFLRLNPPEAEERDAAQAVGLPPEADPGTPIRPAATPARMQGLATLPKDHLTLEAVREAINP